MASPDPKSGNAKRFERAVWRDRLRLAMAASGLVLAGFGGLTALRPFGPPISNPVAIPKADPDAGLALLQALPSGAPRQIGLMLIVVGGVLLLCSALLGPAKSQNAGDKDD